MSRLTRVIAIALMSVMIISTVTSCTLMSKNRIIKYAEQNIGECKVISEEYDVKGKRINFYKIIDKNGTCLASYNSAKDSTTYFKNNTED